MSKRWKGQTSSGTSSRRVRRWWRARTESLGHAVGKESYFQPRAHVGGLGCGSVRSKVASGSKRGHDSFCSSRYTSSRRGLVICEAYPTGDCRTITSRSHFGSSLLGSSHFLARTPIVIVRSRDESNDGAGTDTRTSLRLKMPRRRSRRILCRQTCLGSVQRRLWVCWRIRGRKRSTVG